MDYSSMYPNIKISSNIGAHTQHGRLIIEKQIIPDENPDNNKKFIRAGKFIEDLETCDGWKTGTWLSLPTSTELIKGYSKIRTKKDTDFIDDLYNESINKEPVFINGRARISRRVKNVG